MNKIYKDDDIFIEWEESTIPWVKIFTQTPYKELSECPALLAEKVWKTVLVTERAMIDYFNPEKINIASFGNHLPIVHIHVMARFKEDSHFPEPMWGAKQRDTTVDLPDFQFFEALLRQRIKEKR